MEKKPKKAKVQLTSVQASFLVARRRNSRRKIAWIQALKNRQAKNDWN